jgi:hypothetical protein
MIFTSSASTTRQKNWRGAFAHAFLPMALRRRRRERADTTGQTHITQYTVEQLPPPPVSPGEGRVPLPLAALNLYSPSASEVDDDEGEFAFDYISSSSSSSCSSSSFSHIQPPSPTSSTSTVGISKLGMAEMLKSYFDEFEDANVIITELYISSDTDPPPPPSSDSDPDEVAI